MRRARPWTLVAAVVFVVVWGLTTHGKYSSTGDEPHYLIVAESLVSDGDLDLANNYAHDDGRLFGHAGLVNDGHARPNAAGRLESVHDIGLAVALAPPYLVAKHLSALVPDDVLRRFRMTHGLFTYSLLSLLMAALTAFSCGLLVHVAEALTSDHNVATLMVLTVALAPPVLSHAFLIFPEVPAFAVTCGVLYVAYATGRARFIDLWLTCAALGLLPWFHRKYSLFVIGLLVTIACAQAQTVRTLSKGRLALLAASFAAPIVLLYLWTWHEWGNLAGPQMIESTRLSLSTLPGGAVGLWADREYGVLSLSPVYFLVPAALILAGVDLWPLLMPAVLLFVPMASFSEWWGGFCPAGRYLVPIMPIVAVGLSAGAVKARGFRYAWLVLALPQIVIAAIVWQHPRWLWPQNTGTNEALQRLGAFGRFYQGLLPSVRTEGGALISNAHLLSGLAVMGVLTWLALRARESAVVRGDQATLSRAVR